MEVAKLLGNNKRGKDSKQPENECTNLRSKIITMRNPLCVSSDRTVHQPFLVRWRQLNVCTSLGRTLLRLPSIRLLTCQLLQDSIKSLPIQQLLNGHLSGRRHIVSRSGRFLTRQKPIQWLIFYPNLAHKQENADNNWLEENQRTFECFIRTKAVANVWSPTYLKAVFGQFTSDLNQNRFKI